MRQNVCSCMKIQREHEMTAVSSRLLNGKTGREYIKGITTRRPRHIGDFSGGFVLVNANMLGSI